MPTLLHLSDLHRTSEPRLENDELLDALASDAMRWDREGIPRPDVIVVSGDLVQGVGMDIEDPDSTMTAQYAEANDFLQRLTAAFVDSDRSRVIVVPGNHDVHWKRAREAMKPLTICPEGIARKALEAKSNVRWSWSERRAYTIDDFDLYDSRLEHFRRFQADFYADLDPSPLSQSSRDVVFVDYPPLGLAVTGLASWHGNDCLCHVGDIDLASLASARKLLSDSSASLAVAVWHHSVVGGPRVHDYMDQRVIHKLIDFGFSVGLHGHQHYSGAAPYELRLPNLTSMVVVGAGSLAVGDRGLPMGERRQFNIIVIDPDEKSVTVHVRAMSPGGVFTGSYRDDFGGKTFITLSLPRSPSRSNLPACVRPLDDALTAVANQKYEHALDLLHGIDPSHSHERRQIKILALENLGRHSELIELLNPPQNVGEVVKVIAMLLNARRFDDATSCLEAASALVDKAVLKELTATIAARRTTS